MDQASSNAGVALFIYLAVGALSLFTFLSVAVWTSSRRKEREAYYTAEMMKRIADIGGERSPALDYLREQERIGSAKRLAGYKLGGLVSIGAGAGLMLLMHRLVPMLTMVGSIPFFVGIALLFYSFLLAPKQP
jgi:hypothetical protein